MDNNSFLELFGSDKSMAKKRLFLMSCVLVLLSVFFLETRFSQQNFVTVDLSTIIHEASQDISKNHGTLDQVNSALYKFKNDLKSDLDAFAKKNKYLILNNLLVGGDLKDVTHEFEQYRHRP